MASAMFRGSPSMSIKMIQEKARDLRNILPEVRWLREPPDSLKCFHCQKVLIYPIQLSCGHR